MKQILLSVLLRDPATNDYSVIFGSSSLAWSIVFCTSVTAGVRPQMWYCSLISSIFGCRFSATR